MTDDIVVDLALCGLAHPAVDAVGEHLAALAGLLWRDPVRCSRVTDPGEALGSRRGVYLRPRATGGAALIRSVASADGARSAVLDGIDRAEAAWGHLPHLDLEDALDDETYAIGRIVELAGMAIEPAGLCEARRRFAGLRSRAGRYRHPILFFAAPDRAPPAPRGDPRNLLVVAPDAGAVAGRFGYDAARVSGLTLDIGAPAPAPAGILVDRWSGDPGGWPAPSEAPFDVIHLEAVDGRPELDTLLPWLARQLAPGGSLRGREHSREALRRVVSTLARREACAMTFHLNQRRWTARPHGGGR